jgi:hypothetical protein
VETEDAKHRSMSIWEWGRKLICYIIRQRKISRQTLSMLFNSSRWERCSRGFHTKGKNKHLPHFELLLDIPTQIMNIYLSSTHYIYSFSVSILYDFMHTNIGYVYRYMYCVCTLISLNRIDVFLAIIISSKYLLCNLEIFH